MSSQKLGVGRILHFYKFRPAATIEGVAQYPPALEGPYPAQVVRVWSPEIVNVVVFHDGALRPGEDGQHTYLGSSVRLVENKAAADTLIAAGNQQDLCCWPTRD